MGATILRNGKLHLVSDEFKDADSIVIQDRRIIPVDPHLYEDGSTEEIDLNGLHVAPGFIDLLVNGCAGVSFPSDLSSEGLERMRRYLSRRGTLTFVPTLVSGPRESMTRALTTVANFRDKHPGVCPGLHLEGPFINTERKGFHPIGYIRNITDGDISYLKDYKKSIAYMTIAPEVIKTKYIQELIANDIRLSIGHSNASFADTMESFSCGINNVTHLFNGMKAISGRDPGIIGAVCSSENVFASIIADGRHIHPTLIKLMHQILGDRLYIISDSQSVVGSPEKVNSFTISGTEVFVDPNRGLIDSKGALAGSTVCLMDSVKFLIKQCDFTVDEALQAASLTPARVLGIDDEYGKIEGGYMANLIIFDDDFKIKYIVQNGFLKTSSELL